MLNAAKGVTNAEPATKAGRSTRANHVVAPVESVAPAKKKGRPKGTAGRDTQLSTKVKAEAYADMKRIAERDRISLAELMERAVERYERHRVERAAEMVKRKPGESDDGLVRRAFSLDQW